MPKGMRPSRPASVLAKRLILVADGGVRSRYIALIVGVFRPNRRHLLFVNDRLNSQPSARRDDDRVTFQHRCYRELAALRQQAGIMRLDAVGVDGAPLGRAGQE